MSLLWETSSFLFIPCACLVKHHRKLKYANHFGEFVYSTAKLLALYYQMNKGSIATKVISIV
jgi:hypothetical protein